MRATLSDVGIPQAAASYDAWGVPETPSIASFGFTGELQQGSDVWLRARWYGAGRGSFGTRDPYAGDAQTPYSLMPYQYAYANPALWVDPSGHCIPPLGYLRQLEPANCSNLEAAVTIWKHPKASPWEKSLALTYITAWSTGHVCALAGAGIITAELGAAIATGSAVAHARALVTAAPMVVRWLYNSIQRRPNTVTTPIQKTIDWLENQPNRVSHIMQTRHAWDRLIQSSGNALQDYRVIQPYLSQVMATGGKQINTTRQSQAVLEFTQTINGHQIIVRAVEISTNVLRITDAWIVTP